MNLVQNVLFQIYFKGGEGGGYYTYGRSRFAGGSSVCRLPLQRRIHIREESRVVEQPEELGHKVCRSLCILLLAFKARRGCPGRVLW